MATGGVGAAVPVYEERTKLDQQYGMDEADRFFDGRDELHEAMRRIAGRLHDLNIPHVVVGGMAHFVHGYRRLTNAVDILVTPEGIEAIQKTLVGKDYGLAFAGKKHLRDTGSGVCINFLIADGFPGDGRPKPLAFPDPTSAEVGVELDGVRYLSLPRLVELKLVSGIAGPATRYKHHADVIGLIEALDLPAEFAEQLDPYVRAKYAELWTGFHESPRPPWYESPRPPQS